MTARKVSLDKVRRRLYDIVLEGEDRDSVNAARILLREDEAGEAGPDTALLDDVRRALMNEEGV